MKTMAVPLPSDVAADSELRACGAAGVARPRHCEGLEVAETVLRYEAVRGEVREESWRLALRSAIVVRYEVGAMGYEVKEKVERK